MSTYKINLIKSPSTGAVEVVIHDSIYMAPDRIALIPESGTLLEDPASPYRRIAQLEHELAKAKRGKQYICTNLKNS